MYSHILLSTDLSPFSEVVSKRAYDFSKQFNAKLSLVHAVELTSIYAYGYVGFAAVEEKIIEEAKKNILVLGERFHIDKKDCWIEAGNTKSVILNVANKIDTDLIVIGSHGRHGLSALLGSTANAVLHGAEVDVLTVQYQDRD